MGIGPQSSLGAKPFVLGLFGGGRRGGAEVSAVLDELASPPSVEFLGEGPGTAVSVQCVGEARGGALEAHSVGDLTPGATFGVHLRAELDPKQPFRFVWWREDWRGRVRAWSYDGRSKRLRGDDAATAEAVFRAMYP